MNPVHLQRARNVSAMIGARLQLTIPSILAEGEAFTLRMSAVGPDALPHERFTFPIRLDGEGIEGLPDRVQFAPGEWTRQVAGLRATASGVARVRAHVEQTRHDDGDPTVSSNPAWVSASAPERLYWGDLHVHTKLSNCSGWRCLDPEWCYAYAREASHLDFAAAADHLRGIASGPGRWARLQQAARDHNAPEAFVSFLAFESSHAQGFGGDNNVYFLNDNAPHFWVEREDMRHGVAPKVHLKELWAQMDGTGQPYFSVPHHTGRAAKYRAWDEDYYSAEREPLFEIYSSWGSSEMRHSRLPISGGNNDAPSYFVDALRAGARFGVIASSDDHATLPGAIHYFRVPPFGPAGLCGHAHKGLAAVRAPALTREALFDALRRRATYATTSSRSILEMDVDGTPMGQELKADASLRARRCIRTRFTLDQVSPAQVVLMRNGQEIASQSIGAADTAAKVNEICLNDPDPLEAVAVRGSRFHPAPFVVYYVRIEDRLGFHLWTSPVWIDLP